MRKFLAIVLAILLPLGLSGCTSYQPSPVLDSPDFYNKSVIYEVNLRQYTQAGTIKAFDEHLPRLSDLGVDILWLMPINPISEKNKKGELGSPYSVANYLEVNPDLGTKTDLKNLVEHAHSLGMKVILDWVANHTGWDNPWITEHPDWYTQDDQGNIIHPSGTDWTDVADLNYDNQQMRQAMISAMKFWVTEVGIDGYRADVAHSVPIDFWNQAAKDLRSIKDVFMIAEDGENLALLKTAFNTNYAWPLSGLFTDLAKGFKDATDFRKFINTNANRYANGLYQMVFIDNHDENSWHGTVFERMGNNVRNMALLAFTLPGMPLIYSGQEIGLDRSLKFFEKDPISWPEDIEENPWFIFYQDLITLRDQNPALFTAGAGGEVEILNKEHNRLIAFARSVSGNTVIVLANLGSESLRQEISFGDLAGSYTNWQTGQDIELDATESIELGANQFLVLTSSR